MPQVEIENAEWYRFDGECLSKAEEMGHPGIVTIKQKQVTTLGASVLVHVCLGPPWSRAELAFVVWRLGLITVALQLQCTSSFSSWMPHVGTA